jgi:hypothetical protein
MQLALTNVINISVSTAQTGVNAYNTSNLALFADAAPQDASQTIAFSGVAASGSFVLTFASGATAAINWNDTADAIQTKINAVTGQSKITVAGSIASKLLTLTQAGEFGAIPLAVVSSNTLETVGTVAITVTPTTTSSGWSGGSAGYAFYLEPTQVATDFGSSSDVAQMATAVFAQQPNILTGGGQLIVILLKVEVQTLTFSAVSASGAFELVTVGGTTAAIQWNDPAATIASKIQTALEFGEVKVYGSISQKSVGVIFRGAYGPVTLMTVTANTLQDSVPAAVTVTPSETTVGETIGAAITRMAGVVQFFGIMVDENLGTIGQTDLLAAAAIVQALVKVAFWVSSNSADIAPGGMIDLLRTGTFTQSRGLYYGDTTGFAAVLMMAAYAGRALSTNFSGSNTTQTMHLKALSTINPDPSMTQTLLNTALAAGADTYVSLQGVSAVFCSGLNRFFDQVYNQLWFVGALQVAGFNYLAQTGTKIPQTEAGMDGLKGAYRTVCEQAVTNQYCAPGSWNSPTVFGVPADLIANVAQRGYYIYSLPVSQQLQVDRAARKAPLVQIALKEAGAIQQSSVIVNINA